MGPERKGDRPCGLAARKEGRPTRKWRRMGLDRLKHKASLEEDSGPRRDPEATEDPHSLGTEFSAVPCISLLPQQWPLFYPQPVRERAESRLLSWNSRVLFSCVLSIHLPSRVGVPNQKCSCCRKQNSIPCSPESGMNSQGEDVQMEMCPSLRE